MSRWSRHSRRTLPKKKNRSAIAFIRGVRYAVRLTVLPLAAATREGGAGHQYLRLRDKLGTIYDDARFAALFPAQGRPAEAPWCLALVTVLQFAEGLTDRQAADAVRDRLAWKYLLGLELTDTGFAFSILSDFRARLVAGGAEGHLLDALLDCCKAAGLIRPRGAQRTDSTHVLAAVRSLNRVACVGETLRHALNTLAVVAPDWLRLQAPPAWYER
jgi:transposase